MNKVMLMWEAISSTGLEGKDVSRRARQVRITNRIALLGALILTPHLFTYLSEGQYIPAIIHSLTLAIWFSALILTEKQHFLLAKLIIIVTATLNTVITITFLGYSSGEHFAFLLIVLGAAMMLDPITERKYLLVMMGFVGFCLLCMAAVQFDPMGFHLGEMKPSASYVFNFFLSFLIVGLFGLHFQIISNRQVDGLVLQARQEMEAAFDHSYDAIFLANPETGLIVSANKRSEELFGGSRNHMVGHSILKLFRKTPHKNFLLSTVSRLRQGETWTSEEKFLKVQRGWFWGNTAYTILAVGEEERLMIRITDVTVAKQNQFELERAKYLAESANIAKANFFANMSHEIRTPINGILGLADIITDAYTEDEELYDYARMIRFSGERLLRTLDSVLALSQLEASTSSLNWELVSLQSICQPSAQAHVAEAKAKGLEFTCQISPHILLQTDPTWFQKVLDHMISNAIKFTKEGAVEIHATMVATGNIDQVLLTVSDTGIGMSDAFIREKLFKKFSQESEGLDRNYEGAGLGLSIAKRVIEILGGRIEIFSTQGQGSTFRIFLPQFQHELPSLIS